jgi:hypothetical protein
VIWQTVRPDAQLANWQAIDFKEGRFAVVGDQGRVAVSSDGRQFQLLKTGQSTDYLDIVMLTKQQLILLGKNGSFEVSNDSGTNWLKSEIATGMNSRVIALAGKDKIISADSRGKLGLAQLVAEIALDSPLKEGVYQPGDFLFLETFATAIPDAYLAGSKSNPDFQDRWDLYGPGEAIRKTGDVPDGGGQSAMQVKSPGAAPAAGPASVTILSQLLDPNLIQTSGKNEIYRVELWMRQDNLATREVKVWLSGSFPSVGTTFSNVGSSWKKYAYTFVLPASARLDEAATRLNISFTGGGTLLLDRVFLGRAAQSADELSDTLVKQLKAIQPGTLRFGFLPIGQMRAAEYSWAQLPGNETPTLLDNRWTCQAGGSLAAALKMANQCQSDPWLVIGSHVSEAELLNLLEYLTGPISEGYGKLRMDQGMISPWTEKFNHIYLEFNDSGNLFQSDSLRADFVDMMIHTISKSPYYLQIKHLLVFVDGMQYKDGVILSSADYHASDISGQTSANPAQSLADTLVNYYDNLPRNPEKPMLGWAELVRSATITRSGTYTPSLAEFTALQLQDLGVNSGLVNLSLPMPGDPDWLSQEPVAALICSAARNSVPLTVKNLSSLAAGTQESNVTGTTTSQNNSNSNQGQTSENLSLSPLNAHGFRTDTNLTVILANLSDKPVTCQLETVLPLQGAKMIKYDRAGKVLNSKTFRRINEKLTVLPGGVVFLQKSLDTTG